MAEFQSLTALKAQFPSVPSTVVLKVINRYGNDKEKCKQALEIEKAKYAPSGDDETSANNCDSNVETTAVNSCVDSSMLSGHMRELQVSHVPSERHISTIERPVGGTAGKPVIGQSVSWTVQTSVNTGSVYPPSLTPQTAPADFTPFMYTPSMTEIPQIGCNAFTGKPHHMSGSSASSSSSSPGEQRRLVKLPPGSSSGGSVSPAATQAHPLRIHMHFGDSGGVCQVSGQPAHPHRPQYRTEYHAETSAPIPVQTCSSMVNATEHTKLINSSHIRDGRRVVNPPMTLDTTILKPYGLNGTFSANEPLSIPVQASSPGTVNSKPMFVETHQMQMPSFPGNTDHHMYGNSGTMGRGLPGMPSYPPHSNYILAANQGYGMQYPTDYNHSQFGYSLPQNSTQYQAPQPFPYQSPGGKPAFGYLGGPAVGHLMRTDSQDSAEYDPRTGYGRTPSQASSHSSPTSEGLPVIADGLNHRPKASSFGEDNYLPILLQHQRSRRQKLSEESTKYQDILNSLRRDVSDMERSMRGSTRISTFPSEEDIAKLCETNRSLQTDIQMYMNELEMYKIGQVPINGLNAQSPQNFFDNMPTGQQDPTYARTRTTASEPAAVPRVPPPRPPPPLPQRQPSTDTSVLTTTNSTATTRRSSGGGGGSHFSSKDMDRVIPVPPPQPPSHSGDSEEGERWNCVACTFLNFPALKYCEICGLLRDLPSVTAASTTMATAGGGGIPPALPPHEPLTALPPRLVGGQRSRSRSPSSDSLGRHLHQHRSGT